MLINHWVGGILFLVKPICSGETAVATDGTSNRFAILSRML